MSSSTHVGQRPPLLLRTSEAWTHSDQLQGDDRDRWPAHLLKAAEFRAEQARIMADIDAHRSASQAYGAHTVTLRDLADRAHALFQD